MCCARADGRSAASSPGAGTATIIRGSISMARRCVVAGGGPLGRRPVHQALRPWARFRLSLLRNGTGRTGVESCRRSGSRGPDSGERLIELRYANWYESRIARCCRRPTCVSHSLFRNGNNFIYNRLEHGLVSVTRWMNNTRGLTHGGRQVDRIAEAGADHSVHVGSARTAAAGAVILASPFFL